MARVGYARVSSVGQSLEVQLDKLKHCDKIYQEKKSGASSKRPRLKACLEYIREGDTLVVTRLDRLARSTRDLLNVLDAVAKRNAGFKSLADAWADTTTAHGRLMLTVLGGLLSSSES